MTLEKNINAVTFSSKGLKCSGLLYKPSIVQPDTQLPAIVMAHGLSGVKEQALPQVGEIFAHNGFVTLVFDYRFFGDSEGEPRNQVFPLEMVEDFKNAITWVSELPEVDSDRIGIWGTSLSGGIVLYTATFDKRVRAVVAQVPAIFNPVVRFGRNRDAWHNDSKTISQDRLERFRTGIINYIPIVNQPGQPCVLTGKEAYDFFMSTTDIAPNWRNQMTVESIEKMREFDVISSIELLSPTPIIFIPAENDGLISIESIVNVYNKISEPKSLVSLPITHFEIYSDPWLSKAANIASEWYQAHL
ncbi:MAG: alpha/beta fold hydrolase [Dehalococcoidales bacterium]|nr:MAG: alpha/beta fold hydrolase [Dehalococcoidales bacterium]